MNNRSESDSIQKISSISVLREAWHLIPGMKLPIFLRMFLSGFLLAISGLIIHLLAQHTIVTSVMQAVVRVLFGLIISYIFFQMTMLGDRRALSMPFDEKSLREDVASVKKNIFYLVIIYFLIVHTIDEMVAYFILSHETRVAARLVIDIIQFYCTMPITIFSLPLVVIKHAEIGAALAEGFRKMGLYWKEITICFLCVLLLPYMYTFSILTKLITSPSVSIILNVVVVILMIWLMPMSFNMAGIFFRDAYRK